MTIRSKLAGIISTLGILLFIFNTLDAVRAYDKSRVSAIAAEINIINDQLYDAAGAFAVERGTINGWLQSAMKATSLQQEIVTQARAKSTAAVNAAMDRAKL